MSRKHTCYRILVADRDSLYAEWLRHHLGVLLPDSTLQTLDMNEFDRWSESLSDRDWDLLMLTAPFGSCPEDPNAQGLELLRRLRERQRFPAVIAIAEEGNELTAVRALQLGAIDYLPKRLLTAERLRTTVKLALRRVEKRLARRLGDGGSPVGVDAPAGAELAPVRADDLLSHGTVNPQDRARDSRDAADAAEQTNDATAGDESVSADPTEHGPGGEFMPADFIPGYTIHGLIGESEKAVVYVASSAALGHNVALKISKTLRDEAAGRQFLEREYTAIVAIQNPCVVKIFDYGVHSGYEYLVMEYLPTGDLKARMQQGLTEREALRYVEQIAAALGVVHHSGLLHRDLKPPNVMLRETDEVALIDFGLARALDGSTPSTRIGVLRGSPYYMSPEQALGEQLDARSDFYSLGIMFYEMLTGRKPYTGLTAMDVLQQHVNAPVPQLPQALEQYAPLLAKMLAKSRDERFSSAEEVLAAIARVRVPPRAESSAA